jgi:hypothetical protein
MVINAEPLDFYPKYLAILLQLANATGFGNDTNKITADLIGLGSIKF